MVRATALKKVGETEQTVRMQEKVIKNRWRTMWERLRGGKKYAN